MRLEEVEPFISEVEPVEPLWKGEGESSYEAEIPVGKDVVLGGVVLVVENPQPTLLAMPSPALTLKVTAVFTWLEPAEPAEPTQPGGPVTLPAEIELRIKVLEEKVESLEQTLKKLDSKMEGLEEFSSSISQLKASLKSLEEAGGETIQAVKAIDGPPKHKQQPKQHKPQNQQPSKAGRPAGRSPPHTPNGSRSRNGSPNHSSLHPHHPKKNPQWSNLNAN